jgi:DNA-directed RNA polymerase I subunit RPA1
MCQLPQVRRPSFLHHSFLFDRFRLSESKIRLALIKLKLIEMGMVKESNELEDLFIPPAIFNDSAEEATDHLEHAHTKLAEYEEKYANFLQHTTSKPNSLTISLQRAVLDAFQKSSIASKKCESCGGFSPPLRKDGYTKLFEKPLQKRLRKSMQGMKMKLKPALERLHKPQESIDDDSDEEVPTDDEGESKFSDTDKYLAPIEVEARMKLLWQAHPEFLNFIWYRASLSLQQRTPSSELWRTFFIRAVLVPPSRFRPPADLGDVQSEHPQNLSLSKILSINEKIDKLRTIPSGNMSTQLEGGSIDISKLIGVWIDLQNAVNCFIDSTKDQNVRPDDAVSGIRQILEKKEGLFRRHMMGKRVNYCCRSVISPDPFLGMNEIGIPVQFAKELHYPTPVTSWNVKMLRQMVENGPSIYPGTTSHSFWCLAVL